MVVWFVYIILLVFCDLVFCLPLAGTCLPALVGCSVWIGVSVCGVCGVVDGLP